MIKASVIIPNWNGKHLLKTCLVSLSKQTLKNIENIVVDNGSEDGSVDYVRKFFPGVKIVELDKNYGFAKAVNIGLKKSKAPYVVLLNNDTEADQRFLEYLFAAAKEHPEVGFVTGKALKFHQRNIIYSAGDAVDVVGHSYNIGLDQKDGPKFDKEGYVFIVTAGGSLFKREVFEKIGYFDEDYVTYMEDVDLCLRAQLVGFKGWYEPRAKLYHIGKATSSKIIPLSEYWHFRNMMQNIIKDYPLKLLLTNFNWLRILLVNINTVKYMVTKGYLWQALKAEGWILLHLPGLLRKRFKIQQNKKVSDQYIINNIGSKKNNFF